ncbi:MAG: hypothetical protein ACXVGH_02285 [Mycobacteriales bacterium]
MRSSSGPSRRALSPVLRLGSGLTREVRRRPWLHLAAPLAVALVAGLVCLGLAETAHSLRVGGAASGTVSDRTETKDSVDVSVSFEVGGEQVDCSTSEVDGEPQVGDVVQVRYARDDPEGTCAVGRAGESYVPSGIAGGVGLVALGRFGWVLRSRRRRPRSSDDEVWTDTW